MTEKFAFLGRVSTEDNQDPQASRAWQLRRANETIRAQGGAIVAEYFDVGVSRSLPWRRRPEAARLLAALPYPDRGWSAVVIGEPHRAFYGSQFALTFPLLTHYGVELWVPEVGGRVDPDSEAHDLMMAMFGGLSKAERARIKTRVRSAMAALASEGGRWMGGRPPYGYRLVDAGPHPNPSKAADGKRLHRLDPDPQTAPVVERIYRMYADEFGLRTIAEALTADGIPSPSAHDPGRNRHRDTTGWAHSAVRAILANPVYGGVAVWGKQRKFEHLVDPDDVGAGHITRMNWQPRDKWIEAKQPTHASIVDRELFEAVTKRLGSHVSGRPRQRQSERPYQLRGLLRCAVCERRMQGAMRPGRILYRCEYAETRALPLGATHPPTVYVREDAITGPLDEWLASLADPHVLAAVPPPADGGEADKVRAQLVNCETRLSRLVAAIEDGGDPAIINPRIAEIAAERDRLERRMAAPPTAKPLSAMQISLILESLGGLVSVLREAAPDEKARLYQELGVTLTYDPGMQTVHVRADLSRVVTGRVGGGT